MIPISPTTQSKVLSKLSFRPQNPDIMNDTTMNDIDMSMNANMNGDVVTTTHVTNDDVDDVFDCLDVQVKCIWNFSHHHEPP